MFFLFYQSYPVLLWHFLPSPPLLPLADLSQFLLCLYFPLKATSIVLFPFSFLPETDLCQFVVLSLLFCPRCLALSSSSFLPPPPVSRLVRAVGEKVRNAVWSCPVSADLHSFVVPPCEPTLPPQTTRHPRARPAIRSRRRGMRVSHISAGICISRITLLSFIYIEY